MNVLTVMHDHFYCWLYKDAIFKFHLQLLKLIFHFVHFFDFFSRWLRNGTELDLESDYRYVLIDGNLIISIPNEAKDSGQYQCIASNILGRVLSREATLQFACE